jgi:hypothetical protein
VLAEEASDGGALNKKTISQSFLLANRISVKSGRLGEETEG